MTHNITTVENHGNRFTRECTCGWVTIGETPEPAHHTSLAEREREHLREAAAIEDGTVWQDIPARHEYQLHLRRRLSDQTPNHVVITAVWMGGSREVLIWPWNAEGLADAQEWCDRNYVVWADTKWRRGGDQVQPDSLAVHAGAR